MPTSRSRTLERPLGSDKVLKGCILRPLHLTLEGRSGRLRDLDRCRELLRGRAAYASTGIDQLPSVWRRLVAEGAVKFAVVEREAGAEAAIVAFGMSAFVTDPFVADAGGPSPT
jgi:hypothetical protein